MKTLAGRVEALFARQPDDRTTDLCLALASPEIAEAKAPSEFLAVLVSCMEPLKHTITVKKDAAPDERLTALCSVATRGLPSLPLSTAVAVAKLADSYVRDPHIVNDGEGFCMDVDSHLRLSSSFGEKGRLLTAVATLFRPTSVLELGTAYGMSAAFLAEATNAPILTVETWEPMKSLSKARLDERYPQVTCLHVPIQEHLRDQTFDCVFHDADHSEAAYRADFTAIEPHLAPGAVFVIDDIEGPRGVRAGWDFIISHKRIRHAVEIDGHIGVAVLR